MSKVMTVHTIIVVVKCREKGNGRAPRDGTGEWWSEGERESEREREKERERERG